MKILGISAYYHDSAAALIVDGKIKAAAQEERFTRKKNDEQFPALAISYCLQEAGITLSELDAIVFYDKPFLKFERLVETYATNAPKGFRSFIKAMPVWLREKLFLKSVLKKALREIDKEINWNTTQLMFSAHHLSHAASAFYPSGLNEAAILCVDGVGEWATATIAKGKDNTIEMLQEMHFPDSVGLLYSSFTYYLGFTVNEGEYKVMGLAPYAVNEEARVALYRKKILDEIVSVYDDGSVKLNPHYFEYATSLRMINEQAFQKLFDLKRRLPEEEITAEHCAIALALQQIVEDVLLKMAKHARALTGCTSLCLAGGVALNGVANGVLKESNLFDAIFVQPAAGDAGGALGAALGAYYLHFKAQRLIIPGEDDMQQSRLGPSFSSTQIEDALHAHKISYKKYTDEDLVELITRSIIEGKVVGWFKGRMEFGPRALGGRSIIANPADSQMQSILNLKVKKRESFRPFAPVMLEDEFKRFFGQEYASPYMLFVHKILPRYQKPVQGYTGQLYETINQQRSVLPAITHVDYSSRIQTIKERHDKHMHRLLTGMKQKTGYGVLINTSFNVKDEPIVCTPDDAIRCFLKTGIDILVLENYVASKWNS